MKDIIINSTIFKRYRNSIYYVSQFGDVYSTYSKKILKPLERLSKGKLYYYIDVRNPETNKVQHTNIHKMVWIAWNGEIPNGYQINHINDNSIDNRLSNLYVGTQKENISDCELNNHRVGNCFYLTVYDNQIDRVLTFCPAKDFIDYSGHPNKSGSLNKFFNKNWFKKRFDILEFKNINNLSEYQNVTTMGDECNPVRWSLSPSEVHRSYDDDFIREEIV